MSDHTEPRGTSDRICFLHIGPHKTGTTSIQNALFVNAERLATIGLHYPTLSDGPGRVKRNHTPLARMRVMRSDDFNDAPYWRDLGAEIAALPGSIVISTEHFADVLRDEERYRKTVDFFHRHGFRIVVVAYVRDQPAWLNSWYTQDQRNFMSLRSFGDFVDDALDRGLVDPQAILRRFIDDERIEVRVVSFDLAVKDGLAGSFLKAIGAPEGFSIPEPKASNPNLGVKGLYAAQEIMRRVGFRVRSMASYPRLYETFKALMKGRGWEKTAYIGATPEDERRIRERYARSNDAFARQWLGMDWASACPPRALAQREFDFAAAGEDDRRDVLDVVEQMVALIQEEAEEAEKAGRRRPRPLDAGRARAAKAAEAADAGGEDETSEDPAEDDPEAETPEVSGPRRRRGGKAKLGKAKLGKGGLRKSGPRQNKPGGGKSGKAQSGEGGGGKKRPGKADAGKGPRLDETAKKARRKKKKEAAAGLA